MSEKLGIPVVDDNQECCRKITDILKLKDYQAMTAGDGVKGLDLVRQNGFGLMLMDIRVPARNTVETLNKVKEIVSDIRESHDPFEDLRRGIEDLSGYPLVKAVTVVLHPSRQAASGESGKPLSAGRAEIAGNTTCRQIVSRMLVMVPTGGVR